MDTDITMNIGLNMTILFSSPTFGRVYNTNSDGGFTSSGGSTTNTTPNTTPNITPNATPRKGTVPNNGYGRSSGPDFFTRVTPLANNTQDEETIQIPVHAVAAIRSTLNQPSATSIFDIVTDGTERRLYLEHYNRVIGDVAWKDFVDENSANQLWLFKYVRNDELDAKEWQALYKVTNKMVQAKAIHYRMLASTLKFAITHRKFDTPKLVTETTITSHIDDCLGPQPKFGKFVNKAVEDFARANTLKYRLYHLFYNPLRKRFAEKCPLAPKHWLEVANVVYDIFGLSKMVDKQLAKMVRDTIKHIIPRYPPYQLPMALDDFASHWHDVAHLPFVKLLYQKADGLGVFLAAVFSGESRFGALVAKQEYFANLPKITLHNLHAAFSCYVRETANEAVIKKSIPTGPRSQRKTAPKNVGKGNNYHKVNKGNNYHNGGKGNNNRNGGKRWNNRNGGKGWNKGRGKKWGAPSQPKREAQ